MRVPLAPAEGVRASSCGRTKRDFQKENTAGGRDESGKLIPIDIKVGDRILFGKWSGTEVKIDGVEYLIMKESDIMGVLIEAEAKNEARKKAA